MEHEMYWVLEILSGVNFYYNFRMFLRNFVYQFVFFRIHDDTEVNFFLNKFRAE